MQTTDPMTKEPYEKGVRDVLRRWQQPSYIRLHAGEMTAQEMRSVLAVVKCIAGEVDVYLPPATGQAGR